MIKIKLIILILFILFFSGNIYAETKTKIIAKIGDEIITNFDVENKIKTTLFLSGEEINQENVNKVKTFTLKSLVNLKLKSNEVKKHNISKNDLAISQYLNSVTKNLKISEIDLITKFKAYGIDYDQFLKDIETEFLWQRLVAQIYLDKIKVNEEQINRELKDILNNEKKDDMSQEFNLSEIEVTFENSNEEKQLVLKIADEIKKNSFEKTAIKFSISSTSLTGGQLGWISSNQISNEIFDKIKNLQEGEISQPLKKGNTITFLKLNKKRISKKQKDLDINVIKKNLENSKKNELLNLYSDSHLSKIKNITLIEFL
tara:strand:- start:11319 stop:12266 length:948 start_codon:yes stop_codon:yes gene_type:complete